MSDNERQYWRRMMDEAYAFMQRVREYPIAEAGESVVYLPEFVASEGVDIRFSQCPHVSDRPRLHYLREGLAGALVAAGGAMNARGWAIRIEDAYRSTDMQTGLTRAPYVLDVVAERVIWESPQTDDRVDVLLRRTAALCANWPSTATHMSASAIDISVLDVETEAEIDRGGPYLELSHLSPMYSPFISREAADHRAQITEFMAREGFVAYPYEFWHFSKGDTYSEYLTHSGRPARYGPVDIDFDTGAATPLEDPRRELNPRAEVEALAMQALARAERHTTADAGGNEPVSPQAPSTPSVETAGDRTAT